MKTIVITKDVENTPLIKGDEITLDHQTASLMVNVEKVAEYKKVKESKPKEKE